MTNNETAIIDAAQAAHEANRAYCDAIGDTSQVAWGDAPQWQRDSCVAGARFVLDNPNATPADQHQCWLDEKRASGWTYGETKDADAKTHPCFVPYDELPASQRCKDSIFGSVVRGVLEHHGLLPR